MKILVVRFSSIGDIVLTTPVVRCLRQQLNCEVHYLTKQSYANILQPNPYIHKVWTIQKKVNEVTTALKAEQFDYIIDLHKNLRSWQLRLALHTTTYSFDKINREKWLMTQFKIDRLPDLHIVDRYLETVKALGVKNDGKGLDYFIPEKEEVDVAERFGVSEKYTAFAIGAAHATKRLPTEKIIAICQQLDSPTLLLGGLAEQIIGEQIVAQSGQHTINTCGAFNLHQSASIVRQATTVITHDTGMMHIAAAFQKRIVSVWGNTIPEFGMYAYYGNSLDQNTSIEVSNLACRPCSKIGYSDCPKGHFRCMEEQDVGHILREVRESR
jgi:ADP-heptose:LPS heptosyltransferase